MASVCLLCGSPANESLVCDKCDRRRRSGGRGEAARAGDPGAVAQVAVNSRVAIESPAIEKELSEILRVVSVPVVVFGSDRKIVFLSSDAKTILAMDDPRPSIEQVEKKLGLSIRSGERESGTASIAGAKVNFSLHPLSSGGTIVALRIEKAQPTGDSDTTLSYISDTVLAPLRALQDALRAAAANRNGDPVLDDAASTIEQIFSSLELSPLSQGSDIEKDQETPAADIVKRVGERFARLAELKKVRLQVDVPAEGTTTISDQETVQNVLVSLMENSLHYVPSGGQIVIGLRTLEQKGKKQALLFVMDNGPIVPAEMRESIFANDFVWKPTGDRSGRALADARRFAQSRGGQVWVEAKGGKACTFFLRLPAVS